MSRKRLDNKGFTLVELIVTLAIIIILLLVAYPAISHLQARNQQRVYQEYGNLMEEAARLYMSRNERDRFEYTYCEVVHLEELINENLIKEFTQVRDVVCDGHVLVLREGNRKTYEYRLLCEGPNRVMYESEDTSIPGCAIALAPQEPRCGPITGASTTWRNTEETITVECRTPSGRPCTQPTFEKSFGTDANSVIQSGYIEISNDGISRICPVNVFIDRFVGNFGFTGSCSTFTARTPGIYQIQLWGASGGEVSWVAPAGRGGFTEGRINLDAGDILFVCVGQQGRYFDHTQPQTNPFTSWNGGGSGGHSPPNGGFISASGGGATDIRVTTGAWNNVTSLRSRIMVAGGGGGAGNASSRYLGCVGGAGGGLSGLSGGNGRAVEGECINGSQGAGGTQTAGHAFGVGGNGGTNPAIASFIGQAGGGGGFYGGRGSTGTTGNSGAGGGGGSSFISGHAGSNAINTLGVHTNQPNHFSGRVFTNTRMIAGNASMPNPDGGTMTGRVGHGHARITYLGQ